MSKYFKLTDLYKNTYVLSNQRVYINPLKKGVIGTMTLELIPNEKYDLIFENRDQDEVFIESLKEHTERVVYSEDVIKELQKLGYCEIERPRYYNSKMGEKTYYISKPCGGCGGSKSKRWIVFRLVEVYDE